MAKPPIPLQEAIKQFALTSKLFVEAAIRAADNAQALQIRNERLEKILQPLAELHANQQARRSEYEPIRYSLCICTEAPGLPSADLLRQAHELIASKL